MERWGRWLSYALAGAVATAFAELLLASMVLPAVASDMGGAGLAWMACSRYLLLCLLPGAALLAWLEPRFRVLPEPGAVLSLLVCAGLALASVQWQFRWLVSRDLDFLQALYGFLLLGHLATLVCVALLYLPLRRCMDRVCAALPTLGTARSALVLALLVCAALLLWLGHFVLAPAHRATAAAGAGLACAYVTTCTIALWVPRLERSVRNAAHGVGLVLLSSWPVTNHPHARAVVFGPASSVGGIAAHVRDWLDADGDGTSSRWWGGTDCDEGDGRRGPLRIELPGVAEDQDCDGQPPLAQAPAPAPPPASPLLPSRDPALVRQRQEQRAPSRLHTGCPRAPRSVLLVTIDAWRAETLRPEVSPGLSQFAGQSTLYARAYAPSTMTSTSLQALFTGRSLTALASGNVLETETWSQEPTAAELFAARGYAATANVFYALHPEVKRGFQHLNPDPLDVQPYKGQLLAASTTNAVLAQLERAERASTPAFIWAHYGDTHAPYPLHDAEHAARVGHPVQLSPYERGVHYVDRHVTRLLLAMSDRGLLGEYLVAISSDHGEQTGARARLGHGSYLFEDTLHVPLILWVPGCPGRVETRPVSLRGLLPELMWLSSGQWRDRQGLALAELDAPATSVVVEQSTRGLLSWQRALIDGRYKLIADAQNGGRWLFDLQEDPSEANSLYTARPELAAQMEAKLTRWLQEQASERAVSLGSPSALEAARGSDPTANETPP